MKRDTVGALMVFIPIIGGIIAVYVGLFLVHPVGAALATLATAWIGIGLYLIATA